MQSDPALLAELAKGRLREKRALVAVGHSLLVTGYYMNTRQVDYKHLGAHYFDERNKEAVKRRAVKRLEQLGYQVELKPVAALSA